MEQQKHLIDSLRRPESISDADSVEVAGQVCRLQRRRCPDPILAWNFQSTASAWMTINNDARAAQSILLWLFDELAGSCEQQPVRRNLVNVEQSIRWPVLRPCPCLDLDASFRCHYGVHFQL